MPVFLVVSLTPRAASACTTTWKGTTSTSFNTAANWSASAVPGVSDDVCFDTTGNNPMQLDLDGATLKSFTVQNGYTAAITAKSSVGSLIITGNLALTPSSTGGSFQFNSGTTRVGGAFTNNGRMTIDANGGAILFNATSSQAHTFGGASMPTTIINDGLAAYWTLDDGSGPAADSSGYGNDLTRNGTTTFNTTVPSAVTFSDADMLTFNGTTGYATNASPAAMPSANAAQTLSLWAKFAASANTQAMLALTGPSGAVVLGLGSSNIRVWKSSAADLAHTAAPTDNAWHHIAYSYDGVSADKIYLDGVLMTGGLGVAHDAVAPTAVFMGAASAGASFFNGSLDDVRIYKRALTAREIADLAFGHLPGTGLITHTFSDAFLTANGLDLVIASGVVAGAAAVTVGGSWINYGGRFTGTGAVTLTSTKNSEILLSAGQVFSNLTVNASGKYTTADRLWMSGQTLKLQQAGGLSPAFVAHVGSISEIGGNTNGFATGSTGTVVIDGGANLALAEKNFFGLRLEDPSETGIVGYWKLDEGQSTTAKDVSGSGNTGALSATGSTWTNPPAGITFDDAAAVKLDGATGYVSLGTTNLPAANGTETISAWVKLGSTSGTQDFVALGDGAGHGVKLGLNGGTLAAFTWAGASLVTGTTPVDGAWHNVVYSYDGTNNRLYVDGVAVPSTTTAHQSASTTVAYLGTYDGASELYNGAIDDVRVYNTALTAAQVGQLARGRYAGTGGVATVTQTNVPLNIPIGDFGFMIDSGNYDSNDQNVTVSVTTVPCIVYSGTLHIGSKIVNCDGGLTINPMGTLLMDATSNQFQPGKNSTVAIDGTFTASNASAVLSRDNGGETYSLQVGTFTGSTPILDITGLIVRFTEAAGMQIDNLAGTATGATTTIRHFDNITFRQAPSGGAQYLEVYSKALNLSSSGCIFGQNGDNNFPSVAVKLIGNGTGDGETRAVFGATTCQSSSGSWTGGGSDRICVAAAKSDDDSDGNGIADSATASSNGAIVQFVRAAEDDTAGSVIGFPTAAFNWNTFTYYSTYVAFHNAASGSSDVVYVRDELGNPLYSWTVPAGGGAITGTPQWNTSGSTHFVYVATSAGNVYRLIDTATGTTSGTLSLDTTNAPWSTNNPFSCGCTISTPLGLDASNLYWGSTTANKGFWTLGQSTQTNPTPIVLGQAVTNTGLSMSTISSTAYAFMGVTGAILQISTAGDIVAATNSSPGTHSVFGRIVVGQHGGATRVYAGDDGGTMWAIDAASTTTFGTSGGLWSRNTANAIKSAPYYDYLTDTVQYGTQGGTILVLGGGTGALLNSGYPYTPAGGAGDPITAAPLYNGGVLAVGSTGGKLYFLDRNTGTTPAVSIIREYNFGSTESVSGIAFDPTVNRYMVTTANASTNDGRLYYIDLITDPTPSSL